MTGQRKIALGLQKLDFIKEFLTLCEQFKVSMQNITLMNGRKMLVSEYINMSTKDIEKTKTFKAKSKVTQALVYIFALFFAITPLVYRMVELRIGKTGACHGYCIFSVIVGLCTNCLLMFAVLGSIRKFFVILEEYRVLMKILTSLITVENDSVKKYDILSSVNENKEQVQFQKEM